MNGNKSGVLSQDNEPKYRKKAKKSPPKKANHPHVYSNCVYAYLWYPETTEEFRRSGAKMNKLKYSIGTYCSICGKVGTHTDFSPAWWDSERGGHPFLLSLMDGHWTDAALRELDPKTRTLPTFHIDYWKTKYVELR